jgi:FkbM family methyltransferase
VFETLKHSAALAIKRILFSRDGEPYTIAGTTLHFVPGTRPVHPKYRNSPNGVTRYDAMQVEMVAELLNPGDFAIDIGGHVGQYALIMAARCGATGKVISFEPDAHARKQFIANLALNKDIAAPQLEALALSDQGGPAILFSRGGDANSSLSLSGLPSMALEDLEQMEVTLCTLDDYLREHALPVPQLVKIDTEGAEIRILSGAKALLVSDAIILCELHPYAWEGFGNSFAELQQLLIETGRHMRYIDQPHPLEGEPVYGVVLLER